MPAIAAQRFLANNRNVIREAALIPSSVLPIDDGVISIATARDGKAQVLVAGSYTGAERATYDIQIVDDDVETPRISTAILTGEGSGALVDIDATGAAQEVAVELVESGLPLLAAALDFEGQTIKARTAGASGNGISISVDQSGLTFAPQSFSLLQELAAGQGGQDSALRGSEFDYDTKIMGADGQIPADAHRIAFGSDRSTIYLQYKQYKDGEWLYFFVPALKRAVPRGAVVNFVTGGRTVTIATGSPAENIYPGIVTLYDLLNAISTDLGSPAPPLTEVDGVVANDRAPTGQAAQELQARTDAHFQPSYGTGSESALGFEDVSVAAGAGTQLVIATCRAVTASDHPLAHVGATRWELASSTLGPLGTVVEGRRFSFDEFAGVIPLRTPFEFAGGQKGRFTVTAIEYRGTRADGDPDPPPICPPVGENMGLLGPAAADQTLTFVWTKRPSGDCNCVGMPFPNLNTSCLGNADIAGGESMTYETDTIERIKDLREWYTTTVRANSLVNESTVSYAGEANFISAPTSLQTDITSRFKSLRTIVDDFERTLALIDPLEGGSPSLRSDGCLAWDDAFSELQGDIANFTSGGYPTFQLGDLPSDRYDARLGAVLAAAGLSALGGVDASILQSGDGCWRDIGDAYYFALVGSAGAYAPVFVNTPYYSSRRAADSGLYFSTHEFGLQINVKPECVSALREGDTITAVIGVAGQPSMYQVGDQLFLPIIAAANLYLAGGQDASLVQTWNVKSDLLGPLPSYLYDPDAPTPYMDGSPYTVTFLLVPGGIPFAKGDRFTFRVVGGHWQWRKNGGAWNVGSPPEAIPTGPVALDEGLLVEFVAGAAPSFVAGDIFSFLALQPWAASNIQLPDADPWKWSGSGGSMVADSGSVVPSDAAAFAFHTLPVGATLTVEGGTAPGVYDWLETATWSADSIALIFTETRLARYRRLTVANAPGAQIGFWWCGMMFGTSLAADTLPRRVYKMARGTGGLNGTTKFLGKGIGGNVGWTEAALSEDDMSGILEMADWVKVNHDEPFLFLPQVTRPADAFLVKLFADEIEMEDVSAWQADANHARRLNVTLPLQPVFQ